MIRSLPSIENEKRHDDPQEVNIVRFSLNPGWFYNGRKKTKKPADHDKMYKEGLKIVSQPGALYGPDRGWCECGALEVNGITYVGRFINGGDNYIGLDSEDPL